MAYPLELKLLVIKAYYENDWTYSETADFFNIGEASVSRWLRELREGGNLKINYDSCGRKRKITAKGLSYLKGIIEQEPDITLGEIMEQYNKKYASISLSTIARAVRKKLGLTRKKNFSCSTAIHEKSTRSQSPIY